MIKTYWKAIHTDRIERSEDMSEIYKPYTKVTRANLVRVVFYEKGKEETPIITFEHPTDIVWRLRPLMTDGGNLLGRRWVIEVDGRICIIDYENKPNWYDTYEEADTFPILRTGLDEL